MKRIICYLRTIKEFGTFINVYINFGAIYIAHNYKEIHSKDKNKQVLKCQTCGHESVSYIK